MSQTGQTPSIPSNAPSAAAVSVAPADVPGVRTALTRYRVLAYATGIFLLLLTVNLLLKYVLKTAHLGPWVAIGHGWLYLVYVLAAVDLWFRTRLPVVRTIGVVLAGTIPFASFVAERWVTGTVRPALDAAGTPTTAR